MARTILTLPLDLDVSSEEEHFKRPEVRTLRADEGALAACLAGEREALDDYVRLTHEWSSESAQSAVIALYESESVAYALKLGDTALDHLRRARFAFFRADPARHAELIAAAQDAIYAMLLLAYFPPLTEAERACL
jgi:hypothetical protein